MSDAHQAIARLEEEIESLADRAEGCVKLMHAARIGVIGGIVALALVAFGILRLGGLGFTLAVSAILIGIVAYGSNRSTLLELRRTIAQRQALRDRMIDEIAPREVGGRRDTLH